MKLFNRKNDANTSDEIKNYYAEERRDRTGVAWLLAAATLVVTLLLALGLFYGGRWVYRTIFDGDDSSSSTLQQEQGIDESGEEVTNQTADESEADGNDQSDVNNDDAVIPGDETEESNNTNEDTTNGDSTSDATDDRLPSSGALPATGPTEPEL